MKAYIAIFVALLALVAVGCQQADEYPQFEDNQATQENEQLKALQEALSDLAQENKELREEIEQQDTTPSDDTMSDDDDTYSTQDTRDKFMSFMDDEDVSFNDADCDNGLISIAKRHFDTIQDRLEGDLNDDIDNLIDDDIDSINEDLSDFESDFKSISWSSALSESSTSGLDSRFANVTYFTDQVASLVNSTDDALDDVEDALGPSTRIIR